MPLFENLFASLKPRLLGHSAQQCSRALTSTREDEALIKLSAALFVIPRSQNTLRKSPLAKKSKREPNPTFRPVANEKGRVTRDK
jgi:hypothetical protein